MPDYSAQLNQARAKEQNKINQGPATPASSISGAEFMFIGAIALINDLCDWFGLDLILFRAVDLVTAGALGLWCITRLRQFPTARFGGSFLIELIPGLGDLSPTWTFFILSVYIEQKGRLPKFLAKSAKTK